MKILHWVLGCNFFGTSYIHTVPEQKLNNSKKMTTKETWTFYLRRLLLFSGLSYYFIPCLRLTKSSMLLSAPLLASTQQVSLVVIENVTDIFFPKRALLERCATCFDFSQRRFDVTGATWVAAVLTELFQSCYKAVPNLYKSCLQVVPKLLQSFPRDALA